MEQLRAALESVGLSFDHVVQIKSFVKDISRADQLRDIVAGHFKETAPPQVVTEWLGAGPPAEIELIAAMPGGESGRDGSRAAPDLRRADLVALQPCGGRPGRPARVHLRPLRSVIRCGDAGDRDVRAARGLLEAAGSNLTHLVKATYYVSDTAADDRINAIRPTLYDPKRPPAASKIRVRGTGRPGKGSTMDMIAVTAER